ncbi:MAG: BlaI family penicillinase repressor [Porticoccaceae bacterium]|jgi:BlaI family penicillinase repressor
MAGQQAKELTERELVVMRAFWDEGPGTADEARQRLAETGVELAYVTVANVVRGLEDKGFLKQLNKSRPFQYRAARSFEDVSKRLVGDLVERLFDGSRQKLLVQVLDKRRLSKTEREFLKQILVDQGEDA